MPRCPVHPTASHFGSRDHAAEELVAELGAAFMCAEFGFDGDLRHAAYIATWIELLKADKRAFFTACSKASQAATTFVAWLLPTQWGTQRSVIRKMGGTAHERRPLFAVSN